MSQKKIDAEKKKQNNGESIKKKREKKPQRKERRKQNKKKSRTEFRPRFDLLLTFVLNKRAETYSRKSLWLRLSLIHNLALP